MLVQPFSLSRVSVSRTPCSLSCQYPYCHSIRRLLPDPTLLIAYDLRHTDDAQTDHTVNKLAFAYHAFVLQVEIFEGLYKHIFLGDEGR